MRFFKMVMMSITTLAGWLAASSAYATPTFNMQEGVTPISRDIYDLHMTIFFVCVGIAVVVFGVMTFALIRHRKSRGVKPATFHEHTRLEVFWAIVPVIILVIMAIPATRVLSRMSDTDASDVNIKITGYQWKWQYEYLDQGISFYSNLSTPTSQLQNRAPKDKWYLLEVDKPLVVPIHKKIRFLVTSNDVIHSWWVPAFGIKRDAIPGFIHEAWTRIEKPGIYRGQCAELCGLNHGYMPIVVEAVSEKDYEAWLAKQHAGIAQQEAATQTAVWTKADLMKVGETAYNSHCAVCHKPDGSGMPPAFPALKGSSIATGPLLSHLNIVMNGKTGTAMQAFSAQLNNTDIAAIVTYERNAWGNDQLRKQKNVGGDLVQPSDVEKLRSN